MDTIGFISWASIVYLLVIIGIIAIFITSLSMFIRTRTNRKLFTLSKLQRIEDKLDRLLDMQAQTQNNKPDQGRSGEGPENERKY
ncbi:DUF4083 family protein [Paenibacillus sp. UNC499MF]|uniref:DUF4083 family protein n=1 Tax=Paenibacillus sp. UNC499MF TaxID=1502751 RepID=UPI00089FE817|nr:DUF4083 family protein [Paenibacillus sp. UNC499MF]SEF65256.1 protein of unknown function [Paenibacillus sp. UNC499MF]